MDAVTEILLDRSREADAISKMVVVSLLLHAAVIGAIAFFPGRGVSIDNAHVISISFAGPPGPVQGHNPESAKPVQQAAPPTAKPQPEAPPALAKPEMVEPLKTTKVQPKPQVKPEPQKPIEQLHSRMPTTGPEVKQGTARIETHSPSQAGFGLATGGGGAGAATTDLTDFCCPEYLQTLQQMIYGNWQQRQGQDGTNELMFTIHRDGTITDVKVEQSSNPYLNLASQRALAVTQKVPPLPAAFTGDHLTVHLVFQYKR